MEFKDRILNNPKRRKITRLDGNFQEIPGSEHYYNIEDAFDVVEAGTPLDAATLNTVFKEAQNLGKQNYGPANATGFLIETNIPFDTSLLMKVVAFEISGMRSNSTSHPTAFGKFYWTTGVIGQARCFVVGEDIPNGTNPRLSYAVGNYNGFIAIWVGSFLAFGKISSASVWQLSTTGTEPVNNAVTSITPMASEPTWTSNRVQINAVNMAREDWINSTFQKSSIKETKTQTGVTNNTQTYVIIDVNQDVPIYGDGEIVITVGNSINARRWYKFRANNNSSSSAIYNKFT